MGLAVNGKVFMNKTVSYTLDDLLYLMSCLRDQEHGCPWDCKQDFSTIVPHTIEEAYEVADAIERGDYEHLQDELGDLLFQVIFYGQLGQEKNHFSFQIIVDALVKKLLRRHPHVFPLGTLSSFGDEKPALTDIEIKENWDAIKSDERQKKDVFNKSALDDVPHGLPALVRANKLQKRAASTGFDWQELPPVINKLKEEIAELEEAIAQGDTVAVEDEMGDLLFSCVNLSRHLKLDAEATLRNASRKFERRFRGVEEYIADKGASVSTSDSRQLNDAWEYVKTAERK